ncbi:MAG: HAD family hydrolase [bacterium]
MTAIRIGVIFDFDGTLAPDSTTGFLASLGVDAGAFWEECNGLIAGQGHDPIPVYLQKMVDLARDGLPVTRERLETFGRSISVYDGVPTLFDRLTDHVRRHAPNATVEFYMISSGIETLLKATPIANRFHGIWGSDFVFDARGCAVGIKNVVSFTEKTRYLYQISKGIVGNDARLQPFRVNERMNEGDAFHIPLERIIYVGDGLTDVPCFTLVRRYGGVAIGVYDENRPKKWKDAWRLVGDHRVSTLVSATFGPNSEMERHLKMAIDQFLD